MVIPNTLTAIKGAIQNPLGAAISEIDPFGEIRGGLDFINDFFSRSDMPPATVTRTSHGAFVYAQVGGQQRILGAVQGITENQAAQQTDRFEINPLSEGTPNHIETGNITGRTVNLKILELNDTQFQYALGRKVGRNEAVKRSLLTAIPNFNLVTLDYTPTGGIKCMQYMRGCKIEQMGRIRSIDDDRMVHIDTTIRWTRLYDAQ